MLRNVAKCLILQFGVTAMPYFWPFWHLKLYLMFLFSIDNNTPEGLSIDDAKELHPPAPKHLQGMAQQAVAWTHARIPGTFVRRVCLYPAVSGGERSTRNRSRTDARSTSPVSTALPEFLDADEEEADISTLGRPDNDDEDAVMKFPEKSLRIEHFGEPQLEFAFSQRSPHPKDGLFLYGPHAKAKKSREIRVGVAGTTDGIAHFGHGAASSNRLSKSHRPKRREGRPVDLAHFPGLEQAFGISFEPDECSALSISAQGHR